MLDLFDPSCTPARTDLNSVILHHYTTTVRLSIDPHGAVQRPKPFAMAAHAVFRQLPTGGSPAHTTHALAHANQRRQGSYSTLALAHSRGQMLRKIVPSIPSSHHSHGLVFSCDKQGLRSKAEEQQCPLSLCQTAYCIPFMSLSDERSTSPRSIAFLLACAHRSTLD